MRKVLIVDDIQLNINILQGMLESDYEVLTAMNGQEALRIIRASADSLSAIILDIIMPVMDGYDVLSVMRKDEVMRQIPVLVVTGTDENGAEVKALKLGANDYIQKPYQADIILQRLFNTIMFKENAAIANAARTDALTGLFSRDAFFIRVKDLISEQKTGYYVLSCFDINGFKIINDQYGNNRGDDVLRFIAAVFRDHFDHKGGICCRMNADQFAILYPGSAFSADELLKIRTQAVCQKKLKFALSYSVGRYIVNDLNLSISAMYDRAFMAKESIKGRYDRNVAIYDESMRKKILKEREIVGEMVSALEQNRYEVWFQPLYNHATKAMIGAEALVRWNHPVRGVITPDEFISLYEKNGFIYELDKYVWKQSCAYIRKWLDQGEFPIPVSVNVSRYDLYREDLEDVLCGLLETYHLTVDMLRLEITESAFFRCSEQIIEAVNGLVKKGFTVEIDDFGSGYSSLNTLKDVHADVLKLDLRFLENKHDSERGGNILESVVRMAKWLGMSVVAEGVETVEQADYLKSIGCSYIQGFLYSPAIQADQFEEILRKGKNEKEKLTLRTVQTLDNSTFWDPKSMDTLIFNSFVGGACVFEVYNDVIEVLRVNDKYADTLCGGDGTISQADAMGINWESILDEEDNQIWHDALQSSIEEDKEVTFEFSSNRLPRQKKRNYFRVTIRVIAATGDCYLFYCMNENITAQREAEEREIATAEHMQAILDNAGSGITAAVIDSDYVRFLFANDRFFEIQGYTRKQYREEVYNTFNLIHPEDRFTVRTATEEVNRTGKRATIEYRVSKHDGRYIWVRSVISRTYFMNVKGPVQINVMREITAEKEAVELRTGQYERLLFDAAVDKYVDINKVDMNTKQVFKIKFENGVPIERDIKQRWQDFYQNLIKSIHEEDRDTISDKLHQGIIDQFETNSCITITYRSRGNNVCYRWYSSTLRVTQNVKKTRKTGTSEPDTITIFTMDINDEVLEREKLQDMCEHDGLTDLYNKVRYERMLRSDYRDLVSCGILFLDVNFLKQINDTQGHERGDATLCMVADSIRAVCSRHVHGYRYGGDEFIIVACNVSEEELDHLLKVWHANLEVLTKDSDIPCSVAVGKAWSQSPIVVDTMVKIADEEMYRDKYRIKHELTAE